MSDINNSIGLDAKQAIAEANRLDRALENVNASLTEFKLTGEGALVPQLDKVGKKAQTMGQRVRAAFSKIGGSAKDATDKTRGLALSMGDVARIVQSQILFAAIAKLKQGFFEAADAAAEFQLQVARIEAIEPNFDNFGLGVRETVENLAQDLGRPIEEVSTAAFEAFQNALGDTSQTLEILRGDAQNLALVTGGTLPQAVNALSSIYKTFEGTTEDLTNVSGQLFGTINAGRITMKDLESSLGTIAPLGHQAGVGLQDILDAMATITLTGTKASVATTQLRNVFNKLIKPTDALKDVFNELGVKGFRQLVQQEGDLVTALQKVTGAVDNDEQAVAKLFNTIRGNLGVLNTLTNKGILYAETSARSAEAAERLGEAIAGIDATEAREAAKNAAQLEVIFTRVGDDALKAKNAIAGLFLTIIDDAESAEGAMVLLTGGITAATVATKLFGVSLKTALGPIALIAASAAAGFEFSEWMERMSKEAGKLNDEMAKFQIGSLKEVVKTIQGINEEDVKKFNEEFEKTGSIFNKTAQDAKKAADEIIAQFNKVNGATDAAFADVLDVFGDGRKRILDQLEKAINDIDASIIKGTERIGSLRQTLEDFTFERGLKDLTQAQQVSERFKKSSEAVAAAFDAAANVGLSEESQKAARAAADHALQVAEAGLASADRLGNANEIAKAEAKVQEAITAQIDVEKQLNRVRETLSGKNIKLQEAALKKLGAEQKQQLDLALEKKKQLDEAVKSGLSDDVLSGLEEEYDSAIKNALKGQSEFNSAEILKVFGLDKLATQTTERLKLGIKNLTIDWKTQIGSLNQQLKGEKFEAAIELTARIKDAAGPELQRAIAEATAGGGNAAETLLKTGEAVAGVAREHLITQGSIEESSALVKSNSAEALAFLKEASELKIGAGADDGGELLARKITEPTIAALETLGTKGEEELAKLQAGLREGVILAGDTATGFFGDMSTARKDELVAGLNAALAAVDERLNVIRSKGLFNQSAIENAGLLLSNLNELANREGGIVLNVDDSGVKEVNDKLDKTKTKAGDAALKVEEIGKSAIRTNPYVNTLSSTTGSLGGSADTAAEAFKRMESAAKRAAEAARDAISAGASKFAAAGGQVTYRAGGGGTSGGRGRDTQMVGLQSGEHVSNVSAARNFLPELQAINAGNFTGGSSGGGDTNITIGDVNVTSQGQVGSQTGRDISRSLEREIRRGNIRR